MNIEKLLRIGMPALLTAGMMSAGTALAQSSGTPTTTPATSTSSNDTGNQGTKLSMADRKFVKEAAQGGLAEVELGQLAEQKASNDQVKQFGQRMVTDHTKANDQLKQIASQDGLTLPTNINAKDKAEKAHLSKLSGDQFDKAYMAEMLKDHKKDVSEFEKESQSAKNPDVKKFASETVPTLQEHLKKAESITPSAR